MTKPAVQVICDAGPIIHLDELNCLDLLNDFYQILLPDTVWREIRQHRPSALEIADLPFVHSPGKIPTDEPLHTMCRIFSLDAGESEALSLMENYPRAVFLTDDAAARLVAEQMGYRVHGTVGIIVRAIRRGQKEPEEVLNILGDIPSKSTLYIRPSLLEEVKLRIKDQARL